MLELYIINFYGNCSCRRFLYLILKGKGGEDPVIVGYGKVAVTDIRASVVFVSSLIVFVFMVDRSTVVLITGRVDTELDRSFRDVIRLYFR